MVDEGKKFRTGHSGPFFGVIVRRDGNHVKEKHGGPLAQVLLTVLWASRKERVNYGMRLV